MAEIKVSQLTEASEINDEDLLMIVQNGENKKITKANAKFASGDEVYIGDTEPTGEDDDSVKIWVEPSEDSVESEGTYISNSYGVSTEIGYSENYINTCNTYSTTEIDTGKTWIDGKPIYRIVFNAGSSSTNGQVDHNISNIDTITNFKSYMVDSNGAYYPLPWFNNFNEGKYFKASCTKTQIDKSANNSWGFTVWCIIEYTKTTD